MAFLSQKERRDQMESDAGGRLIPERGLVFGLCVWLTQGRAGIGAPNIGR